MAHAKSKAKGNVALKPANSGPPWHWFCRIDDRGRDVIDEWHEKTLTRKARAYFERTRDHLSQVPLLNWRKPYASAPGNHIFVIRFEGESQMQWRVYGHIDLDRSAFVMTVPAYEKGNAYFPADPKKLAEQHKSKISDAFERFARHCFD